MSPAFDVRVESATGTSGDGVRVTADDADHAREVALARFPDGWRVAEVSPAEGHGDAWGVDLTADAAGEPVVTEGDE